ncbi:TetR/AcrR family transcriptional regulator [Nocardiopsis potens]|uniref:TetR/AcrR family transcriptional regulator n=1 Tax=Nocardiopsis potens TaxID=1246458 RepID=UPI0006872E0E|nr:TetR/AcrR family transcriptional regulator [Nocardiopsis potens]
MIAAQGPEPVDSAVAGAGPPTRERLLAAAWELLGEGGPEAVTLREVGRRAGVSRTAPYRHFQGKEDLLRAVAIRSFDLLRARAAAAGRTAGDAPGALREVCRAYIAFALEYPRQYRLMFGDWVLSQKHGDTPQAAALRAAAERLFDTAAEAIGQGQRDGAVRPGDPTDFTLLTWSTLHGLVTFTLSAHLHAEGGAGRVRGEPEEVLARLVDEVVRGLRA